MKSNDKREERKYKRVADGLIRDESTGIYYSRFRHSGTQVRRSLRTRDLQVARKRLVKLKFEISSREVSPRGEGETAVVGLSELVRRYVGIYKGKAASTAFRAENYATNLLEHLGDRPVGSIKTSEIKLWLAGKCAEMKGSTLNEYLRVARQIFDLALEDGLISKSPVSSIKSYPREKPARPVPEEEELVIRAAWTF